MNELDYQKANINALAQGMINLVNDAHVKEMIDELGLEEARQKLLDGAYAMVRGTSNEATH